MVAEPDLAEPERRARYNRSAVKKVVRTRDDSGGTVSLAVDDALEIHLPETPTTGYLWKAVGLDVAILRLVSSHFIPKGTVPGRRGTRILEFRTVAAGHTLLRLNLMRGWLGEASAVDHFELTVTVAAQ